MRLPDAEQRTPSELSVSVSNDLLTRLLLRANDSKLLFFAWKMNVEKPFGVCLSDTSNSARSRVARPYFVDVLAAKGYWVNQILKVAFAFAQ